MGLKSLIERLQNRAADTPDTPEKNMGYQRKAPIHAGCTPDTPDTPRFGDTRANAQIGQIGEAANDPAPDLRKPESYGSHEILRKSAQQQWRGAR